MLQQVFFTFNFLNFGHSCKEPLLMHDLHRQRAATRRSWSASSISARTPSLRCSTPSPSWRPTIPAASRRSRAGRLCHLRMLRGWSHVHASQRGQIWQNFKILWQYLKALFSIGKILNLLWHIIYAIGYIFYLVNCQILKNNLVIWSQWCQFTNKTKT